MTFNTVNCAVLCFLVDCYKSLYTVNLCELLSKHQNGFNDIIMMYVIGTVIILQKESRDEWKDNSAVNVHTQEIKEK